MALVLKRFHYNCVTMPKLLMINVCANWGSTGRIAEQIGVLAQKNGWDVYMAYGGSSNPSSLSLIKIGNRLNRIIHYFFFRYFDREGLGSIITTWFFVKKIKKIKPDVVHLHNIHGHYLNYRLLFRTLKEMNVPVVWTLHDTWAITGHCYSLKKNDCEKWKTGCYDCIKSERCSFEHSKHNYEIKRKTFTSYNKITFVTVSHWLANIVKESYLKDYPLRVVYNGVDIELFKPVNDGTIRSKYKLENKYILLGVATTWSNNKGLADYKKLCYYLPDTFKIVLLGLTNQQIDSLPDKILGLKRTSSSAELVQWYSLASVVLSLSYGESMGLTPIEGMACGTPAIVYDNTAQPELISNDTGVVVETGNVDDVRQAVIEICKKPKAYYCDNCRKRATSFFEKEKQYFEYINIYKNVL